MKFKFKQLTVAALSLSLVLNSSWIRAAAPAATETGTTIGNIKIEGGEINLDYTGKEQNLINISDYYKGTGTVKYRVGDSGDFSTTVPTATDVGKYDVYYYITGDADYNDYDTKIDDAISKFNTAMSDFEAFKTKFDKLTTSSTNFTAVKSAMATLVGSFENLKTDVNALTSTDTSVSSKITIAQSIMNRLYYYFNTVKENVNSNLTDGTANASVGDYKDNAQNVKIDLDNLKEALGDVRTAQEAVVASSPSHVVVNIVAKGGETPSSDTETPSDSAAPSADTTTPSDGSAAPSADSSSSKTVPMTINYSVSADGTTSTVIDRKGIVWLREESDGTGAWYAIDNSYGAFELGSTFHVKWLKEGDAEYTKYFNQLDDVYKKKAETNNIEIFLVGVTKPDGTEYGNFIRDDKWYGDGGVGLYVQLGDDWDANDINALFIAEGSDKPVTVQYGTADKFMNLYDGILFPEVSSKYARLTLTHFSPYAVVGAKKSVSSSSDLSSYYRALSTKTGEDYSKILCLLSTSSISLLYVLILRKRKFLS